MPLGLLTPPAEEHKEFTNPYSRYIPTRFKRALFRRSNGECEYLAPHTGIRCTSRAHLQVDHVIPLALGGRTELKNLRHLCQAHNLKAAQIAGIAIPAITPTPAATPKMTQQSTGISRIL